MTLKEQLLQDAATFCRERKMSKARLATLVVNDGKFFDRIESGGGFTVATFEKFQAFFSEQSAPAA